MSAMRKSFGAADLKFFKFKEGWGGGGKRGRSRVL
jgi:hypothetical protein